MSKVTMDRSHGHNGMDMGDSAMCSMNMLFTWDTTNLCIVFRQWHITSTTSLIFSLLGVVLLAAGYELVREISRRYELSQQQQLESIPPQEHTTEEERRSLLLPGRISPRDREAKKGKVIKAALYAVQVFYSFFIMLLFMTYNGWVMLAVAVGAFFGYLFFSNASSTKSVACH